MSKAETSLATTFARQIEYLAYAAEITRVQPNMAGKLFDDLKGHNRWLDVLEHAMADRLDYMEGWGLDEVAYGSIARGMAKADRLLKRKYGNK